jgi:hypothetical protein
MLRFRSDGLQRSPIVACSHIDSANDGDAMLISLRVISSIGGCTALIALSACQSATQPSTTATGTSQPVSSLSNPDFKLPEGSGCAGETQRFRALVNHDLAIGFVNQSVYNKIVPEIGEAEKLCAAGAEAKAHASLSTTKRRFGYPG